MNQTSKFNSFKFILVLAASAGSVALMYTKVWAASDVAATVSADFLKRLNQKLTEQNSRAPERKQEAFEPQQGHEPRDDERLSEPSPIPNIKHPPIAAQFGPAPAFIHDNGRFIEYTPAGVMLGWWDLPTGTNVFGYGPGGGIRDAFTVVHATEKSFLKPQNLSAALTSSRAAGLQLPDGIAYDELLVEQYISETPPDVAHGWWDKPDGTIVFARNSRGRPYAAFMVVQADKLHLKPVSLEYAFQKTGGAVRAAEAPQTDGPAAAQSASAKRPSWLGDEYRF